ISKSYFCQNFDPNIQNMLITKIIARIDSGLSNLSLSGIDCQSKKYGINLEDKKLSTNDQEFKEAEPDINHIPKIEESDEDEELEINDPSFNKMRDLLNFMINEALEAVEKPVKGREKKKRAPSTTSQQSFDFGDINNLIDEIEEDDEYEYDESDDDEYDDDEYEYDEDDDEHRGRALRREKAHKRQKSVHEERFEQGMLEFNKSIADFTTLVDAMTTEDPSEILDDENLVYLDNVDNFAQQYCLFIRTLILPFLYVIHYFMSLYIKTFTYQSNSSKNKTNTTFVEKGDCNGC
ncbi:8036_t:CDS:2, partial [Dentiscutata erythropus]